MEGAGHGAGCRRPHCPRCRAAAGRSAVPALVASAAPLLRAGRGGHALLLARLLRRARLWTALLPGCLELLLPLLLGLALCLHLRLLLRLLLGLPLHLLLRLLFGLPPGLHLFLGAGLLLLLLQLLLACLRLRLIPGLVSGLLCRRALLLLARLFFAAHAGGLHFHLLLLPLAQGGSIGHGPVRPALPVLGPHALLRGCGGP